MWKHSSGLNVELSDCGWQIHGRLHDLLHSPGGGEVVPEVQVNA